MDNEVLSRDEVQLIHNLRRNPFFRKMIERVINEFRVEEDSEDVQSDLHQLLRKSNGNF